ncbi:MAG: hypothetical protein AAFW00_04270 [Bacteroidota bacterium]
MRSFLILAVCWMAICSELTHSVYAQSLQQTFELAESYYALGQYESAAETYERVLYFDKAGVYRKASLEHLADAYAGIGAFKLALRNYNFAYYQAEDEGERQNINFKIIQSHLLNKDPGSAQEELFQLEEELLPTNQHTFLLYAGITAFARDDFEKSADFFHQYLVKSPPEVHQALDELFRKNEKVSRLNPKTAVTLSTIFPGLGQFYLGNIKSGLNSLLLTSGLIALTVYGINTFGAVDGVLLGLPWFVRYYQGGFKQAGRLAKAKISRERGAIYQSIMDLVISQYRE